MKSIKNVIWDWNGTILDDVKICIQTMNKILVKYNMDIIKNQEHYQSIFCFPIENYYQNLGFDFSKNDFKNIAFEFINLYQPESKKVKLVKNVLDMIKYFNDLQINQIILSASKKENLLDQVENYKIKKYFSEVIGISDIYAKSKIDLGKKWIKENNINLNDTLIIGDTLHDYEMAKELNIKCILYKNGHQKLENVDESIIFENYKKLKEKCITTAST